MVKTIGKYVEKNNLQIDAVLTCIEINLDQTSWLLSKLTWENLSRQAFLVGLIR